MLRQCRVEFPEQLVELMGDRRKSRELVREVERQAQETAYHRIGDRRVLHLLSYFDMPRRAPPVPKEPDTLFACMLASLVQRRKLEANTWRAPGHPFFGRSPLETPATSATPEQVGSTGRAPQPSAVPADQPTSPSLPAYNAAYDYSRFESSVTNVDTSLSLLAYNPAFDYSRFESSATNVDATAPQHEAATAADVGNTALHFFERKYPPWTGAALDDAKANGRRRPTLWTPPRPSLKLGCMRFEWDQFHNPRPRRIPQTLNTGYVVLKPLTAQQAWAIEKARSERTLKRDREELAEAAKIKAEITARKKAEKLAAAAIAAAKLAAAAELVAANSLARGARAALRLGAYDSSIFSSDGSLSAPGTSTQT